MDYPIPIAAEDLSRDELSAVLAGLPEGAAVDAGAKAVPMMIDQATAALLVDAAKVIVPSLITGIASIWAAHVSNRRKDAARPASPAPIVIVIETNYEVIPIVIDTADVAASVAAVRLPAAVTEITRVRLQG